MLLALLLGNYLVAGAIGDKEGELRGLLDRVSALEKEANRPHPTFLAKEVLDRIAALAKKLDRHTSEATGDVGNTKYVTFEFNSGRIGNQFETLRNIAALAYQMNRTLYFRDIKNKRPDGNVYHPNGRIGLQANNKGIWDVEHMKKNFAILFEEDVAKEYGSVENHPVLGNSTRWCIKGQDGAPRLECVAHTHIHTSHLNMPSLITRLSSLALACVRYCSLCAAL
jgi:hypothetical protein